MPITVGNQLQVIIINPHQPELPGFLLSKLFRALFLADMVPERAPGMGWVLVSSLFLKKRNKGSEM